MPLFIFFLVSLSRQTIDWLSHVIKPIMSVVYLEEDKTIQLFLLNKFENTLIKGKLSLLVWSFNTGTDKLVDDIDEIIIFLNQVEKTRFVFEANNIFSGDKFEIKGDLGCIEINVKAKTEGLLKLCFKSAKKSYGMAAVLSESNHKEEKEEKEDTEHELDPLKKIFQNDDETFEFIKKLEKQYQKNRLILILVFFVLIPISIIVVIVLGFCYYLKLKNKKIVSK